MESRCVYGYPYILVAAVAQMEGISEATLYNWLNQAKSEGKPVPGAEKNSEQWPAEARLTTLLILQRYHVAKQKFKITNWATYNKALIHRGSLTFWLDESAIQA
ncbi:hypothetical protein ACMV5I_27205, partial [Serratia sp. T13T92]